MSATLPRLGIDLGGTKIAGAVIDAGNRILAEQRVATPAGDYAATVQAIAELISALEQASGYSGLSVGVCTPGAINPATGLLKNANSTCLNGKPLQQDLEQACQRSLRLANDADCLAVSEQRDGAASGASQVFAVILGTGVGGGVITAHKLLRGTNAIAGEWGHNPLPWPHASELNPPPCWCGLQGCIETWLSGPGLARDHQQISGQNLTAEEIAANALGGDAHAVDSLARYTHRLARGLASVINLLDPEVIVLGGGLSRIQSLYPQVPQYWAEYVFSDRISTRLVPARHGDASGVRGAAWLWPLKHTQ